MPSSLPHRFLTHSALGRLRPATVVQPRWTQRQFILRVLCCAFNHAIYPLLPSSPAAPLDEALIHVVLDLSGRPHLRCAQVSCKLAAAHLQAAHLQAAHLQAVHMMMMMIRMMVLPAGPKLQPPQPCRRRRWHSCCLHFALQPGAPHRRDWPGSFEADMCPLRTCSDVLFPAPPCAAAAWSSPPSG